MAAPQRRWVTQAFGGSRDERVKIPELDIGKVGSGRNAMTRAFLDAHHAETLEHSYALWPGGKAAYQSVTERVAATRDANPPARIDYRGQLLVQGASLSLERTDGSVRLLVGAERVPEGLSIRRFRLSPDGEKIAVGFGGKGDLETWKVIEIASQRELIAPLRFNSFGNSRVEFMPDSQGIVYPSLDEDVKAARSILFQALPGAPGAGSEPKVIFSGESVLPHLVHVLDDESLLIEASIQIAESAGFPNFTAQLKKDENGVWRASQDHVLPAGHNGRVVFADASQIVYQTDIDHDNRSLVSVDPKNGERRSLVPAKENEALHVVDRVGEFYCALYLTDDPTCPKTDQTWRLRIFDADGAELRTIEMNELGMPARIDPSLSFSGDRNSTRFTEFSLGSVSHPRQTFALRLDALREQQRSGGDVASLPLEALVEKRAPNGSVDFDPKKVGTYFEHVRGPDGAVLPVTYYWAKERPEGRLERFEDLPKDAIVQTYAYGSIGIARTPNNEAGFRDLLERGVVLAYAGLPGGGYRGSESRDRGAFDRTLTIESAAAVGDHLSERFPQAFRVFVGRSWGGWLAENIAALSAERGTKAFDAYLSVVSAGDSLTLIGTPYEQWAIHDFGAEMGERGQAIDREHAVGQARRTTTPELFKALANGAMRMLRPDRLDALGHLIFAVEKNDDRAPPGSPAKSMHWLSKLLGVGPRLNAIVGDGGHGARNHAPYVPLVYNRVLRSVGRELPPSLPLRPEE